MRLLLAFFCGSCSQQFVMELVVSEIKPGLLHIKHVFSPLSHLPDPSSSIFNLVWKLHSVFHCDHTSISASSGPGISFCKAFLLKVTQNGSDCLPLPIFVCLFPSFCPSSPFLFLSLYPILCVSVALHCYLFLCVCSIFYLITYAVKLRS